MAISPELKRIYLTAPAGQYYMEALSLWHPAMREAVHVTNNVEGFYGEAGNNNIVYFNPVPFDIKLPDKDTSGTQAINVAFSNVQHRLIDDIEAMASMPYRHVDCHYRIFINGQFNTAGTGLVQQLKPSWKYEIPRFVVTRETIVAVASRVNMHNKGFPGRLYTSEHFPGLK